MGKRTRNTAAFRKRKRARLTASPRRSMMPLVPTVHRFSRYSANAEIIGNVAYAPYIGVNTAVFSNIINSSEFANLFDQYRLDKVVAKFWLRVDPSSQTAATATYPKLWWYRDLDDSTSPSSLNEMRENQRTKVKVMTQYKPIVITFKPNVLQLVYQSGVANTYSPKFGQWLDMSLTSTPHYGFKYAIQDLTNTNYRVDVEQQYFFSCRNTR